MAFATTPTPGDKYLCANECKHQDCAEHRALASSLCPGCAKAIGFDSNWIKNQDETPWHYTCLDEKIEKLRAERS